LRVSLTGKDSLNHKHKMMSMKGAGISKGYIAAASNGKVGCFDLRTGF
jgi:hypothetical protein